MHEKQFLRSLVSDKINLTTLFYRVLHELLEAWPLVPVDYALQLLHYEYPDDNVHAYAVRCLR